MMDFDSMKISDSDKNKINEYINKNELDYDISDGGIIRYHLVSHDDMLMYIYKYNEGYLITKTKRVHSDYTKPQSYEYLQFKTLTQVIEHLIYHDNSISKTYWMPIQSTVDIGFDSGSYNENWYNDFAKDNKWTTEDWNDDYKYAVYQEDKSIKVISPFNTLHEVSLFNDYKPADMDKLYFEIHPISLKRKNEQYLVKILINNEPILKEYINYNVERKKGLKLFLEELLGNKNRFIQSS